MKKKILNDHLDVSDYKLLEETGNTIDVFDRYFSQYRNGLILALLLWIFGIGRFISAYSNLSSATGIITSFLSNLVIMYVLLEFIVITIIVLVVLVHSTKELKTSIKQTLDDIRIRHEEKLYYGAQNL